MTRLARTELQRSLATLEGWSLSDSGKALEKSFKFKRFNQAFSFMTAIALKAEKMDHHPDWFNSFNLVEISLSTHSAGGITIKDIELATFINNLFIDQKLS